MRVRPPRVSPRTFRRITLLAVWALGFIIFTGGAVRLTGSGLGCPDWPTCARHRVVAPWQYHAMVEFGNRTVTGIVSGAVILAVLASHGRSPRRRDLIWLSWGLVLGLIGQIVVGGLAVRAKLAPGFVMSHFLLSIALLLDALILHHRASAPEDPADERGRGRIRGPARAVVSREQVLMTRLLVAAAALVIVLGTVVTSSGPHGGDPKAKRFPYSLHDVARLHGTAVWLFLAIAVATLWSLHRGRAPASVMRQGEAVILVAVVQGGVGYLQYFTGVPAGLVAVHVALATLLWAVTVRFALGVWVRPGTPEDPPEVWASPAAHDPSAHDPSDRILASG